MKRRWTLLSALFLVLASAGTAFAGKATLKYTCDPVRVPIGVDMKVDLDLEIGQKLSITYTYTTPQGRARTDVVPTRGDLAWRPTSKDFHGCTGPLCVPNEGDRTTVTVKRGRIGIDPVVEIDENFISAGFIEGSDLNRHQLTCRLQKVRS